MECRETKRVGFEVTAIRVERHEILSKTKAEEERKVVSWLPCKQKERGSGRECSINEMFFSLLYTSMVCLLLKGPLRQGLSVRMI